MTIQTEFASLRKYNVVESYTSEPLVNLLTMKAKTLWREQLFFKVQRESWGFNALSADNSTTVCSLALKWTALNLNERCWHSRGAHRSCSIM